MAENLENRSERAPKGIRLCNPLNIERSSAKWYGLVAQSREPRFCEFHTLEYGWRAAIINIAVTYRKRGWNTIRSIIEHWAPYPENDTAGYIDFVSSYTGIPKDRVLEDPRRNFAEYRLVLLGMARMEQGYRWITPMVVDRLDKAIARGEWKRL